LGLFIEKIPPRDLSLADTLEIIGDWGGIAVAPHPFNQLPGSLSMDKVIGILNKPDLKSVLRGIEIYNMTTQPFDEKVQKISSYLPFAKTAGSDAHVYWAIGTGTTEFEGTTAAELRTALENAKTIPHPYEEDLTRKYIFNWLRRITMRKLGYVSHSTASTENIITQRMDLRFAKSLRTKAKRQKSSAR